MARWLSLAAAVLLALSGAALARAEEKISMFWRVFGGTILSITALSVISAYQSLANGIHEVRTDVGHLRETGGKYIEKDEFNSRTTLIWNGIREAQSVSPSVTVLTNKTASLEAQLTSAENERKEMLREVLHLRERLAKLEGAQEVKPAAIKMHAEPGQK